MLKGRTAAAIAGSVESALHTGQLGPGDRMPTVRSLASALRVSPVTVAAAYRLLRQRGVIATDGRRGTRIRRERLLAAVAPAATRAPAAVELEWPTLVDLASGNPDPALLPPLDSALKSLRRQPRLYGEPPHLRALTTFAAAELTLDGIPSSSLAVTAGGLDAIDRLLRDLHHGDRVAVEDPGFAPLLDLLAASGLEPEPFDVDDDGPVIEAFERALRRRVRAVIVTSRAQNPFGSAITADRARALGRVLRRYPGVLLIENDPAGPIAGAALASVREDQHKLWAVVRSTGKHLGPDLRVAIVAGDPLTIGRLHRRHAVGPRWVSRILQELAVGLWSDPANGRLLARAADTYAARRRGLLEALEAHGIPAHGRSGFNVWIPVPTETAIVQGLAARGWAVAAGERFRLRSAPGIRVTTSALTSDAARRLASDLGRLLHPADDARA